MIRALAAAAGLGLLLGTGGCKSEEPSGAPASSTTAAQGPAAPATAPRSGYRERPMAEGHAIDVRVKLTGTKDAPKRSTWSIPPMVRSQCGGAEAVQNQSLSVSSDLGVDDVVVWIDDIHEGAPLASAAAPQSAAGAFVEDEKACAFVPHVLAMPATGTLKLVNSDSANHAARFELKGGEREDDSEDFTKTLPPATSLDVDVKADWAGRYARVTCPIHLWMSGYVFFFEHPYFAVTKGGVARIERVPPGKYHVRVWHEGIGVTFSSSLKFPPPQTATREVEIDGADAKIAFAMDADGKLTAAP